MRFLEGWDMKKAEPGLLAANKVVCLGAGDGVFPIRRMRHIYLVGQGKGEPKGVRKNSVNLSDKGSLWEF